MSLPHILLGLLAHPSTGYELRADIRRRCAHFWAAGVSQIYPALHRLERADCLERTAERSIRGPTRQVYQTTSAGRERLREWLAQGPHCPPEKLPWLAQVRLLAAFDDLAPARDFLERLRARLSDQLADLGEAHSRGTSPAGGFDADSFFDGAALRCARRTLEARMVWCEETIAALAEHG